MELKAIGVSLFLFAVSTSIGCLVGYAILGMFGLVFGGVFMFILAVILVAFAWFYSASLILKKYKAKPSENAELNEIVSEMALNAKIPTPKVYVTPHEFPNSFSVGRGKRTYAVCFTEGMLSLNKGEIESIAAHEIWHIKNGDTHVQELVAVVAAVLRLTVIFIPVSVFIIKMVLSERIEYRADYYASRLAKKPVDLASAISKMSDAARQNPMRGSPAFESIWSVNPFKREGKRMWFYVHPPTARRRKRLEEMFHEGMPDTYEATEEMGMNG
jgi:heat shock protein HtpX